MTRKHRKLSRISSLHYIKLVFRAGLFLITLAAYIRQPRDLYEALGNRPLLLGVIWLVFAVEMFLRFFPSNLESMGCQKQFARNYRPTGETNGRVKLESGKSTFAVVVAWLLLNGVIGALYFAEVIDTGVLLIISLAYSVCDMICILFFCPFQTWFMKNKCCATCRIYNWDYAMMFTPLVFIRSAYTWSILLLALALLHRWELTVLRHPEYFLERTNASLRCAHCPEKLCHHKKQLHRLWKQTGRLAERKHHEV